MGGKSTTSTQSVSIPPEVLARYNAVNARAEDVAKTPFQPYTGQFVAGVTPTQQAGIQQTTAASNLAQPYYQAATQGLQQANAAGQAETQAAYQPLQQGYSQGQQYADIAGQLYAQAPSIASPYYQAATQGVGAGLQYAGGLNLPAIQTALQAPGQAAPLQAYGAGAITGAPGAAQGANAAALRSAMGAQRQAQPFYGAAAGLTGAGAQGVGPLGAQDIAAYQDPYVGSVVGSTLAALQQQQGQERSALAGRQAASGAFGGDRAGLERANLARQQQLATSQAISPLMSQAYQQAVQTAAGQQGVQTQNLARQLQAGQQYAGIGQGLAGLGLQGAQTLSQLGQTQYGQQLGAGQAAAGLGQQLYGQGAQQAQLLANLGQTGFGQQLQAAQQAAALGQGLSGLGFQTGQAFQGLGQQLYGQGAGTAQQAAALAQQGYGMGAGTSQALANLGGGAQQAALQGAQAQIGAGTLEQQTQQADITARYQQFLQQQGYPFQVAQFLANIAMGTGALSGSTTTTTTASDRRLKENIKEIGQTNDGLPIYAYNYKGDDRTQIGLMAQDVEQVKPEAVGLAGGYKTVDYEKATDGSERKARYAGGGLMPSFDDYNSMGGAVTPEMQGQAFARGGYATDGGVGLGDILQAQAALYNAQRGQQGAQKGYFPFDPNQMSSQQRQLMLPRNAPPTQQNAMYDAMKMAGATGEAFKGGKEIKQEMFGGKRYWNPEKKEWAETSGWFSGWGDKSKTNTAPETPPVDPDAVVDRAGGYRGGRFGYATQGGLPYGAGLGAGMSYVPEDVLKQQEAAKSLQFKPGEPPKRPDQLADAVKAVNALNTAKSIYKAPETIKGGLTKIQNFFSPDKAAAGTEAAKGATTAATEAVTPGLGAGASAPAAAGVVPEAASIVPEAATGIVPEAATLSEVGAGLAGGAETAGALAGGAEAAGALAGAGEAAAALGTAAAGAEAAAAGTALAEILPFLPLAFSDARLKDNIEPVGQTFDGQNIYRYDFGDGRTQLGLLAQEVLRNHPDAVGQKDGFLTVDYDRATSDAVPYMRGGLVPREHHNGEEGNVVGGVDTGVIPSEMMALARDPADDERMSERMRTTLPKFREAYPDLADRVTSGFRTPEQNQRAGGAKGSAHLEGKAIDLSLRGLDPQKKAEVLQWWKDQGAGGFGYYPRSDSAHVDFGSPRAWGPNYSRTSLGQTPEFFQKFASLHTGQPVEGGRTLSDAISSGARKVSDAVTSAPGLAYDYANKFLPESDDAKLALLAGIFGTLASPSPHRLGAIGQGGLAAISTYGQLRKMGNEQVKQTIEMMKGRFGEPVKVDGQWMVPDNWQGKLIPQSQVGDLYRQALTGSSTATGIKQTTTDRPAARTEDRPAQVEGRPAATGVAPPVARTAAADRPVALDTTGVKPLSTYDTAEPSPIAFGKPALSRFSGPDMPEDERPAQAGAPGVSMGVMPAYATMFPQTEAAAMQDYKMPSEALGLARQTLREQAQTASAAAAPAPAAPPAREPVQAETAPQELRDKLAIKADLIQKGPAAFANVPEDMNPVILRQKAAALEQQIAAKVKEVEGIERERGSTPQAKTIRDEINILREQRKDNLDRSEKGLNEAVELIYGREKSLFEQQTGQQLGKQRALAVSVPLPEGMSQAQAEFDPDYLASRSDAYQKEAQRLAGLGFVEDAEKARALAEKDRTNLVAMGSTERETPQGSRYVMRPGAPLYQATPPKTRAADYKSAVDPNTGIVSSKSVGEFVGYPETGGFAPDPGLAGRKLDLATGGDKVVGEARAKSQKQEEEFVEGASRAKEAIPTVMKAAVALKYLESKGLTMEKAEAANIANGLGLPELAKQILSPEETNAAYIVLKSSVDQAVQQISQNFARPTQGEFKLTKEEATTDPKLPVEASYSIAKTQLARGLWQNALMSDWEDYKRQTGSNNFVGFKDMWQKTHPNSLFEESASRIMGNLKGQGLPPASKMTEGALYVVPNAPKKGATESDAAFYNYLITEKKMKPGDVFVAKNVDHEKRNIDVEPVGDFKSAYNVALRAPALTYGVR